jgi:tetratricopeptide (TPR) repeat protein
MSSVTYTDRQPGSRVYIDMTRRVGMVLLCAALYALAACGGGSKPETTTPTNKAPKAGSNAQSMNDTGDPGTGPTGNANGGGTSMPDPNGGGGATAPVEPPIVFPNQDPDPAQIKPQVEAHLTIARQKLAQQPPSADDALAEAKEALKLEPANIDAAAYVAFAYYHKKLYDTAELVLDDVFKREAAKQNATVYYVYGLVYDHTNRPEQSVIAYKKAVELNPNYSSALVNVGVHQLQNKQYVEAQAAFEKLAQQKPDAVTLTSLGSAYRGHAADYPPASNDRNQLIMSAESSYKRALAANANYGPAYFNLALLYLDFDPFPSGGGALDTMSRLNAAKTYLDQYKNMPGVDMKLYDERTKDVTKAIKRATKKAGKTKSAPQPSGGGGGGGNP